MILIALGANLSGLHGGPDKMLRKAIDALEENGLEILAASAIWLTEPVPVSDQPLYRNAVIEVKSSRKPQELLNLLHSIELDFGRVRKNRNEARVIDLDLLAYNDVISTDADLLLPHPRMHERGFVLYPLAEIAPEWMHPVLKKTTSEMISLLPENNFETIKKVAA